MKEDWGFKAGRTVATKKVGNKTQLFQRVKSLVLKR
jgi:hypothetical protein